jgi:hypothetical protein
MDRERLTELLQDPSQVAKRDLDDLHSLVERFPWFSGAHLLLAVGDHAAGEVLSNDPARIPAAHLPSRAVLFDLTQAAPRSSPMHVVRNVTLPTSPSLPRQEPTTGKAPTTNETSPSEPDDDSSISMEISAGEDTGGPPSLPAASDPLDMQVREAARSISYDLARELPLAPPKQVKVPEPGPLPMKEHGLPSIPPLAMDDGPIPKPGPHPRPVTRDSRLRFTEWLSASTWPTSETSAVVDHNAAPAWTAPFHDSVADETLPDAKEIIERFIQKAAPGKPQEKKAEFFNPQQAAKRSLQDDGLVSETLARIYEQQGDMAKAIETYARLAVIHPGKSIYFAALSKALQGRSNT